MNRLKSNSKRVAILNMEFSLAYLHYKIASNIYSIRNYKIPSHVSLLSQWVNIAGWRRFPSRSRAPIPVRWLARSPGWA
jgi:hypothetical protein